MAHYAQLNANNEVIQVIVVDNNDCLDDNNNESESVGIAFCQSLFGSDTIWKQTSYNGNFRKHYAGIGYIYDESRDAFYVPQPFNSWILNEEICIWEAPVPYPEDENMYIWNEELINWELVE